MTCLHCGRVFQRQRSRTERQFCSRLCYAAFKERPAEDRFWERVDRGNPDDCWLWQGQLNQSGYGQFHVHSPSAGWSKVLAHRFAYELEHGPIEGGLVCCHRCNEPRCVNSRHLFAASQAGNMLHALETGRMARKLSAEQVREIRQLFASGEWSHHDLAQRYQVSGQTIYRVIKRHIWKHID